MYISDEVLIMSICICHRCSRCVLLQHSAFIWGSNIEKQTVYRLWVCLYYISLRFQYFSSCDGYSLSGSNSCICRRWHLLQGYLREKFLVQLWRSLLQLLELAVLCRSSVMLLVLAMAPLHNRVLWHLIKLHFSCIPCNLLACSCLKAGFTFKIEKPVFKNFL